MSESDTHNLFPICTTSYIKQFQFSSWYPSFSDVAMKATFIRPLDADFRTYLTSDGIFVPDGSEDHVAESALSDNDSSSGSEEENEDDKPTYSFPQLDEQIRAQITKYEAVFPKLNWSSPKDASWVLPTLKCTSPADVYLLLKSSDFILHDLDPASAFEGCEDETYSPLTSSTSHLPYELELVLKKWYAIDPGHEFRCFVRENKLLGICQRDPNYYPTLNEEANLLNIPNVISSFWKERIYDKFSGGRDYVFDVYLNRALSRAYLMDFNPYHPKTDGILFTYEELFEVFNNMLTQDTSGGSEAPDVTAAKSIHDPIFRVIDSPSHPAAVRNAPANQHNAVPYDILHLSAGKDMATFRDTWDEVLKANVNYTMHSDDDDD